jgi:NAD(P)-dependent dehydrogenase (short-subunit alcohol dehydrogenase family)
VAPDADARSVIVTGAAAGIGAACAQVFADAGWELVLVDREEDRLASVAAGCRREPAGEPAVISGDVSRRDTNELAVQRALERSGRLDAVVANAGVNLACSIDETTDEDIDRLLAVNVRGVIYLAQAAHGALADSTGTFIVMASKTGLVAQPDSPLYCATKGAAIQLARALALDWAPQGIRVNAVCPGIVDTPMVDAIIAQQPDPERTRLEYERAQPLGRLARPSECAAAALFLASPEASFITGVALPVDGGFTAQ